MNIKTVYIENFRGYKERQSIEFSDLTAFVGRNDAGKSTILEALDIFFNEGKGTVAIEVNDVNKEVKSDDGKVDVLIGVSFTNLPDEICLDATNNTTLEQEYLLDEQKCLTVFKRFPNGSSKCKVSIFANHPTCLECCDLLEKKITDLQKLAQDLECNKTKKAEMRNAIRTKYMKSLNCSMHEIEVAKEDAKNIWEQLKKYMPVYTLFQADRNNADKDKEVQDPLKEAAKAILASGDIQEKCREIYEAVILQLQEVSDRTLSKIKEMNPTLADSLHPKLPDVSELKWVDVFKSVSITGDKDIPINKRGSGVKRLVLLNFFRAQAEQIQKKTESPGIIYAIEEPETSQHSSHQEMLIKALLELSSHKNVQVVITTHSSIVLKQLKMSQVRLVHDVQNNKVVDCIREAQLDYPSLNEIAFTAFEEVSEEYHNELYGFIEAENWLSEYTFGKETITYRRLDKKNREKVDNLTISQYIRHQIHHPENTLNTRFSKDELISSIEEMRSFIKNKKAAML